MTSTAVTFKGGELTHTPLPRQKIVLFDEVYILELDIDLRQCELVNIVRNDNIYSSK